MQGQFHSWIVALFSLALGAVVHAQTLHIDASNSPYQFPVGYIVAIDDSLILHPGAIVEVGVDSDITVQGVFRALGSEQNPVIIRAIDPSVGWGILDIKNTSDSLVMRYSYLEEGRLAVNDPPVRLFETHISNNQTLQWNDIVFRVWFSEITMTNSSINGSNQGEGLLCIECIDPTIQNCTFFRMPDAVELINCESGLIRGNVFHGMNDDAVDLNHCSDILIDSNLIYDVKDRGLEIGSEAFGSCTNITVKRNRFVSCKEAVNFKEGSTGTIINNTFLYNDFAVYTLSAAGFGPELVEVTNCIFENNNTSVFQDTNSLVNVRYSCFSQLPYEGTGNFLGNPLFANPDGYDLKLHVNSPCINAGSPDSENDPDGSRSDIGAWHRSISALASSDGINVWPVPAKNELNIRLLDTFEAVRMLNSQGMEIQTHQLSGAHYLLSDVSNLAAGVYYLHIIASERAVTIPFVKM